MDVGEIGRTPNNLVDRQVLSVWNGLSNKMTSYSLHGLQDWTWTWSYQ